MATTPMIAPDGSIADVPHGSVRQAIQAGARIAFDMVSPDGQHAAVPLESMHAAIAAGAQLAPSSAGNFAAASVPKPPNPLQGVAGYDAFGPVSDSFGTRVGNRIQQNINSLANLPVQAGQEIQQAASGPHSAHAAINNTANAMYGLLKKTWDDWHQPSNIAGDIATGIIGGAASDAIPAASEATASTRPAELALVPKLTKAYDTLQAIGGGAHAPELSPVLDGLNELSQGVIRRIEQATAEAPTPEATAASTLSSFGTPKLVRSFRDVEDDAAIQQEMQANLDQQGQAARLEQSREFIANNSIASPKWQQVLNAKIDQLVQQAEQKQTTPARPLKPYVASSAPKAVAAAAGTGDDLTDILKASLDLAKKKRGVK